MRAVVDGRYAWGDIGFIKVPDVIGDFKNIGRVKMVVPDNIFSYGFEVISRGVMGKVFAGCAEVSVDFYGVVKVKRLGLWGSV